VKRLSVKIRQKAEKIKLVLLDVDGVLTDGRIIINDLGVETKLFNVRDGLGIVLLMSTGIQVGFVTGRSSAVVQHRATDLGVGIVYQGVENKLETYRLIQRNCSLHDEQIAYAGDDVVDLPVLRLAGFSITVKDASAELFSAVDYVTTAKGGWGAVREIAELILTAQNRWSELVERR
jgi:3-deoxy-D-manno-octulosonate 8-phosphate phosphatase (KDO 8-P phosphatase)